MPGRVHWVQFVCLSIQTVLVRKSSKIFQKPWPLGSSIRSIENIITLNIARVWQWYNSYYLKKNIILNPAKGYFYVQSCIIDDKVTTWHYASTAIDPFAISYSKLLVFANEVPKKHNLKYLRNEYLTNIIHLHCACSLDW